MEKNIFMETITKASTLPLNKAIRIYKRAFKSLTRQSMITLFLRCEKLETSKVEKGNIMVTKLLETEKYTVTALRLSKGAKIKFHMHETDTEYYIIWRGKDPKPCMIGTGHELENDTNQFMYVLSVKIRE